jgi:Pyridoxamine 5'-phosphate oxidase
MSRQQHGPKPKISAVARKDRSEPVEPTATRPRVPGYEFSAQKKGLLPWKWATSRLKESRQYWIATARPDGSPHLMIIWGLWFDESFWFSTGSASRKARNLVANPKCVIGTDDAGKAVILEGAVEIIEAKRTEYAAFAKAYKKKYEWDVREMGQPVYRFRPTLGFGLFEKKFEKTATRWNFR